MPIPGEGVLKEGRLAYRADLLEDQRPSVPKTGPRVARPGPAAGLRVEANRPRFQESRASSLKGPKEVQRLPGLQRELRVDGNRFRLQVLRPWSVDKAPPNFLEPDEGLRRLRSSFGEDKFHRLVDLKLRYDPDNVFSLNVNIPPAHRSLMPPGSGC